MDVLILNRYYYYYYYLMPVSNVCEAAPTSLFQASYGLSKLLEVLSEFLFNLIGNLTMTFFTGQ